MKKRYKFSTALVAAVLLAAVLAGAAFAAGMLGIFDFLKNSANPIVPLEGAEGMVATHLGVSENEWAALTVEEGVFDGQGVLLKCRIAPKDAEKYAMFNCFMQGAPEDVYILENAPAEVGEGSSAVYSDDGILRERITNMPGKQELLIDGEAVEIPTDRAVALEKGLPVFLNDGTLCYAGFDDPQVLGRRDGRETIGYWIDATVGDGMIEFSHSDAQEQADGSVVWWLSGMAGEVLDADQIESASTHGSSRATNAETKWAPSKQSLLRCPNWKANACTSLFPWARQGASALRSFPAALSLPKCAAISL